MNTEYQFMVDFTLPPELSDEFIDLIPYQRNVVNKYFSEGKLVNYALSLENAKLWAVFNAESEMEVMEMIIDFPLTKFMQVEICMLSIYNAPTPAAMNFSLN